MPTPAQLDPNLIRPSASDGTAAILPDGIDLIIAKINEIILDDASTVTTTTLTITTMTLGSVLFAGVGGLVSRDNANFFWDDTNNRLGLGTAAPTTTLDVQGTARISGVTSVLGDFSINTNKLTVASATGNTLIAGTLTLSPMTIGSVLFAGTAGLVSQDTSNLVWDDTNNRLGIGTNAPTVALDVRGALNLTGNATIGDAGSDAHVINGTADFNHAVNMDGTLTLSLMTAGSVLFAGTSGVVTQDNANLFFDDTNNRLGIGVTPALTLHAETASGAGNAVSTARITNRSSFGYSAIDFHDAGTSFRGSIGYGGGSAARSWVQNLIFIHSGGTVPDIVFSQEIKNNFQFGMTNDSAFLEVAKGDSAGLSSANTGRIRYNTANQAFQVSLNGGAYTGWPSGIGTANTIPKWTNTVGALADSAITDDGTTVSFGGRKLSDTMTVAGTLMSASMTGTLLTSNGVGLNFNSSATYDTSGGALSATGIQAVMSGSKTGASAFTQVAGLFSCSGADTNIAIRTNSGVSWLNVTDGQTSVGYTAGAAPTTSKFNVTAASINTKTCTFANTVASSTSSTIGVDCSMTGSMDTTVAGRTFTGLSSAVSATRVAGANNLTNKAGLFTASGGQVNIALESTDGSIYLATTSGSVGIGVASGGTLGAKLTITGDASVSTNLSVNGNATLGDASGDTHTLNGNITLANAPTAGTFKVGSANARIFLARQVLTAASGTYTPTTGAKAVLVRMVGGGGGGGGAKGNVATSDGFGGGGASGAYWEKWIDPAATVTGGAYANGAAGAAGATTPGDGGTGGDTTIVVQTVTYTAKGGTGGKLMNAVVVATSVAGGIVGAGSSAGDVSFGGCPGESGIAVSITAGAAGNGGSSPFGSGGPGSVGDAAGTVGAGNGAGGGGGGATTTTGRAGGAGTLGIIIVDEYA